MHVVRVSLLSQRCKAEEGMPHFKLVQPDGSTLNVPNKAQKALLSWPETFACKSEKQLRKAGPDLILFSSEFLEF